MCHVPQGLVECIISSESTCGESGEHLIYMAPSDPPFSGILQEEYKSQNPAMLYPIQFEISRERSRSKANVPCTSITHTCGMQYTLKG
jgi:hypothetical protein